MNIFIGPSRYKVWDIEFQLSGCNTCFWDIELTFFKVVFINYFVNGLPLLITIWNFTFYIKWFFQCILLKYLHSISVFGIVYFLLNFFPPLKGRCINWFHKWVTNPMVGNFIKFFKALLWRCTERIFSSALFIGITYSHLIQ